MKTGRPSKYNPEFIKKVDDYLAGQQDREYDWVKSEGNTSTGYERHIDVKLPTIEGFARYLGVNKTSLYEWKKKYPIFSNALERINEEQRNRLIHKGLSGRYNSTIAKLVLSANHGMSEKQEIDHTSKGERIASFNYLPPNEENNTNTETDSEATPSVG